MRLFLVLISIMVSLPAVATDKNLLVLGDSLSASYGMPMERGWVHQLGIRLIETGHDCKVQNASITGETTAGAKVRVDDLLAEYSPAIVIIELGGNDGLRGISLEEMKANFTYIIQQAKASGAKVLLIPMRMPTNYGPLYNKKFTAMYEDLSEQLDIVLATFILKGIGADPELMQPDGIHPVAAAQVKMLDNIWPDLLPLLADIQGTSPP